MMKKLKPLISLFFITALFVSCTNNSPFSETTFKNPPSMTIKLQHMFLMTAGLEWEQFGNLFTDGQNSGGEPNDNEKKNKSYFRLFLIILIIFFTLYWIEFFRYRRLSRRAESIPFLSPISILGGIRKEFISRHADSLLFCHRSQINELFKRTIEDRGTLYGEISEIRSVALLPNWKEPPEFKFDQEKPFKIGPFEFYIHDLINILLWVIHVINPYIRKYSKLKFNITLGSINEEMQLTVVRLSTPNKLIASTNYQNAIDGAALTKLSLIENKRSLSCISSMIRDSTFMIFQIWYGDEIPGHNWQGMKHFTEGLTSLELNSRTKDSKHLDNAIENFKNAALADNKNFDMLYLQGYLLLFKRTDDSISRAIICLTNALKSEDNWLKVLINSALANCFAQQVHRLAKQHIVLNIAERHIKSAREELEKICEEKEKTNEHKIKYAKAKIISAEALQILIKASSNAEESKKARENYIQSAKKYLEAQEIDQEIDGQNTTYSNAIGYAHLKLAEQGVDKLDESEWVYNEGQGNPAEIAKKFFTKAIEIDPTNKLVYANLCRLYATKWFMKESGEHYLDLCREYGYKAIRLDPDYINGYADLASSLISYKQFDEAFDAYRKAIEKSSADEKKNEIQMSILKKIKEVYNQQDIDAANAFHKAIEKSTTEEKKNEIQMSALKRFKEVDKEYEMTKKMFDFSKEKFEMLYFAYGSNLSIEQMTNRCPKSTPLRSIKLYGYKIAFVGFNDRWKGGMATIIPNLNSITYGALYSMTAEDVKKLDEIESVETGIYRKMDIGFDLDGISAYTYICTIEGYNLPSFNYLDTIKKGYVDWALPLEVLNTIDTHD